MNVSTEMILRRIVGSLHRLSPRLPVDRGDSTSPGVSNGPVKYMIMMFGDQASMIEQRSTEWIKEMIQFMHKLNQDLTGSR